jgi:hypothetical protein
MKKEKSFMPLLLKTEEVSFVFHEERKFEVFVELNTFLLNSSLSQLTSTVPNSLNSSIEFIAFSSIYLIV